MNIHISGNVEGPTAIFLAGWPDTSDVFRTNVMAALAQDYRIVGLTLPGFHQAEPFFQRYRSHQRQRAKEQKDGDANHHPHDDVQRESGLLGQVGAAASRTWQLGRQLLRRGRRLPHHPTHASTSAAAGAALAPPTTSAHVEEWFPTGVVGHGFQDLISLLEIAVDTAMETNNYFSPSGAMDGRPILIAHGWGCLLAYELLLCRPTFFARMVALDTGASLYEDRSATYAHASASSSQPSEEARSSTTEPRSLASRYAIRGGGGVKTSTSPRPPSNAYKMLVLFVLEAFVLLCMLVVPRRLGQWMLHLFLRAFGRPHYSFDPRHTLRSDTELLNQRLHHHYHLSQNYFDQPTPAAGWHHHHHHNNNRHASMRRGVEQPTLRAELCAAPPGAWSIALIPFLRVEAATDAAPSNGGGGGGGFDERGHRVAARYPKSTHAGRRRRCMAGEFRDSSDDVEDLIHDGSGPDSPRRQSSAITTIYRGYAKAEESADLSGLSHVSPYRSIREAAGATCPSSATQQNARFSPAQFRLKKHAVFYKSYYFPPAPRRGVAGEEEATTTVNAAACVVADPAWGWLFLQFWMGVVLSFVFSDRDSNNNNNTNTAAAAASAPATAPAVSSHHAAHHRSSHHSAHATMRQSRFAPLVTMRYAVPIPIPILFMYGGRKLAMLHSTQWCEYIHTTKRGADGISDVVEVPHGGHWFFAEPTCQALVCQRIIDFLRAPSLPQGA